MNNVNDTKCSICLVSLKGVHSDITITRCNHLFCTTCILNSVKYKNTCPLCRQEIINEPICKGNHITFFNSSFINKKGKCSICKKMSLKFLMKAMIK